MGHVARMQTLPTFFLPLPTNSNCFWRGSTVVSVNIRWRERAYRPREKSALGAKCNLELRKGKPEKEKVLFGYKRRSASIFGRATHISF